jgi:HEAT repeat protein
MQDPSTQPGVQAAVARLLDLRTGADAFGDVLAFGEAAVPALEALLRGRTVTVYEPRCLAADALAAIHGEQAFAALLRSFEDSLQRVLDPVLLESETVVLSHVAELLGGRQDPRSTALLLRALALRPYAAVARALGRIGDARAVPLLVECLYDGSARTAAVDALARFGALPLAPLTRALLAARVKNGFESASCIDARAAAASILGAMDCPAAQLPLAWALLDREPEVRLAAAEALAGRTDPSGEVALPHLLELLGDETWPRAERAAHAIRVIDGPAVEPLIGIVTARTDGSATGRRRRRYAVQLLGKLAPTRAVRVLADLASSPDLDDRVSALHALGAMSAADVDSAIARFVNDADPVVRHRAVDILAARGPAAASFVARALAHDDVRVRRRAAEALRNWGPAADAALHAVTREASSAPWLKRWRVRWSLRRIRSRP